MRTAIVVLVCLCTSAVAAVDVMNAFHFHTYFWQQNQVSVEDVRDLRQLIQKEIEAGGLTNCSLNHLNMQPIGPHPIGSFETCCNVTSLHLAVSFFMRQHGKFSVLLHPLTRQEVRDHTEHAFWMGMPLPLDLSSLSPMLEKTPICPVYSNVTADYSSAAAP